MDVNNIKRPLRYLLISALSLCSSPAFSAFQHDQSLDWQTLESPHFRIHFHDDEKQMAIKAARIGETYIDELNQFFQWIPKDRIDIVISDQVDYANGYAKPFLPGPRMTLYVNPPDDGFPYQDWFHVLIKHELTHIFHLDKASDQSLNLRNFLGNHPLLYPAAFQFRWLVEGLATYMETNVSESTGRGQSSLFRMMMRSEVLAGVKPLEKINNDLNTWPARTTPYLYGYFFFEFIEKTYGRNAIQSLITEYSNNLIPFNLNEAFKKTFNKTLPQTWLEFTDYLNSTFSNEIESITQKGIVEGRALSDSGYTKQFVEPISEDETIIAEYDGSAAPSTYKLDIYSGQKIELAEHEVEARMDYHPAQGLFLAQQEVFRNTNLFYDIYSVSEETQSATRETRGQRFRRIAFSPDGSQLAAVYSRLGRHNLILLEPNGTIKDVLWEGNNNEILGVIDWSPDGDKILASIKMNNASWNLAEFSFDDHNWQLLTDNKALEIQPHYSPDGRYIYYSADYKDTFNIYRLDRKTNEAIQITNVLGGAFHPKTTYSGKLFYQRYSDKGYDAYYLETPVELAAINTEELPKTETIEYQYKNTEFTVDNYNFAYHMAPTWWEPRIYISDTDSRVGLYTSGSDALLRHAYDIKADWNLDAQAASIEFNYAYDRWFPLLQTQIKSVQRSHFVSESFLLEALVPFLARRDRWYFSTGLTYEDVSTELFDNMGKLNKTDSRNRLFGAALIWDSRRLFNLAHSPSDGRLVNVVYETAAFTKSTYDGQVLLTDWREYINLGNLQFLGIRLTHGLGINSPRPFQLGGTYSGSSIFQSSLYSDIKYRTNFYNKRRFPLRGYAEHTAELQGRRMLALNVEWRFPIAIKEEAFPIFPLGLSKLSGTAFWNSASAWNSGLTPKKPLHGLGIELNADTNWFVYFPVRMRIGIATGLSESGENQVYFALGNTF